MKVYMVLAIISYLAMMVSCKQPHDVPKVNDPAAELIFQSECKSFALSDKITESVFFSTDTQTCIYYKYDGEGQLELTHINAGFNCCPGTISMETDFSGHDVTISETEEGAFCDCNCLFDIQLQITNLVHGVYSFKFIEPYLPEGNEPIAFSLILIGETEGKVCFPRYGYPWGER